MRAARLRCVPRVGHARCPAGARASLLWQSAAHLGGVEGEVLHYVRHAALALLLRHAAHAHLPARGRLTRSAALLSGAGARAHPPGAWLTLVGAQLSSALFSQVVCEHLWHSARAAVQHRGSWWGARAGAATS